MESLNIEEFKKGLQFNLLIDYCSAAFGPLSVVLLAFSAEQLFEHFSPYVSPNGVDGIVYFWLHTISLFFILSFGGVVLLRSLSFIRKYSKVLWNRSTPPFSTSVEKQGAKVGRSIVKRAKDFSLIGIAIGSYLAFLFQFVGFVPYRQGMVLTGPLGKSAPNVTVPTIIFELPIVSDLTVLGEYIASPNTLGYILISIVLAPLIVGFWNLTYLFFNYREIKREILDEVTMYSILFILMPYLGFLEFIIIIWKFGVFWFLH